MRAKMKKKAGSGAGSTATTTKPADPIEKAAEFLCYLRSRWRDESEYEDFAEYQKAITTRLPEGSKDIKLSKKFKATFTDATGKRHYIKVTRGGAEWGTEGMERENSTRPVS